jgi:hypothetical protein
MATGAQISLKQHSRLIVFLGGLETSQGQTLSKAQLAQATFINAKRHADLVQSGTSLFLHYDDSQLLENLSQHKISYCKLDNSHFQNDTHTAG